MSASRNLGDTVRRVYFRVRDGRRVLDDEGEGVSPYFWEISWIARSMSSRSDAAGVKGDGSFGVEGVGVSSFAVVATAAAACFFFFFLFLDFLTGVEGDGSVSLTTVSSSSDACASLSYCQRRNVGTDTMANGLLGARAPSSSSSSSSSGASSFEVA